MVEPRENRFHMHLSDDEVTAIDDWRFSNRIATRAEAIRRLCKIALSSKFATEALKEDKSQ